MNRMLGVVVLALAFAGAGCRQVELEKALSVTDVFTGWSYAGVVNDLNKMVPSFTFKLSNVSEESIARVQLLVSFWPNGADGEIDSKQIPGIGPEGLAPNTSTEAILVRSENGYTFPQPKEELFMHTQFRDFTVKVFARSEGTLVPLGEFPVERRIIPSAPSAISVP